MTDEYKGHNLSTSSPTTNVDYPPSFLSPTQAGEEGKSDGEGHVDSNAIDNDNQHTTKPRSVDDNRMIRERHPQLPNEIITLIISHLPGRHFLYECALVSMQFHAIVNPFIWQEPTLMDNDISSRFLTCISLASQRLNMLGQYIRSLHLSASQWTDARLIHLLPHLPLLTHISIHSATAITDTSFQQLLKHCPHLTSLKLISTQLTKASFAALGQHGHQLRHLRWYVQLPQSPEWLAMLKHCPLETLQIYSQDEPLNEHVLALIKSFDQLTHLRIDHSSAAHMKFLLLDPTTADTDNNNNNSSSSSNLHLWPRLVKLDLSPCDAIDDPTFMRFIKSHPHLQVLDLSNAKQLTGASLETMASALPHLTGLTLTRNGNITTACILRFIQLSPPGLASITLRFCRRVTPPKIPEWKATNRHGLVMDMDKEAIERVKLVFETAARMNRSFRDRYEGGGVVEI